MQGVRAAADRCWPFCAARFSHTNAGACCVHLSAWDKRIVPAILWSSEVTSEPMTCPQHPSAI